MLLAYLATFSMAGATAASAQAAGTPDSARGIPAEGAPFLKGNEVTLLAVAAFVSIEVGHFDTKIAHYMQSSSVQGGDSTLVRKLTNVNETTLTLGAALGYGVGRLTHSPTITDVSAHLGEALLLTNVVSQAIRGPFGRARPYVTHDDDNSNFHVRKGFTSYDYRSLPSLHSASAFAAASALTAEMNERHFGGTWIVGPALFAAATIPGLTRMYLDQHWASDVVMGGFLGAYFGQRVVNHAHSNARNRLDRILLGTTVAPAAHGGYVIGFNTGAGTQ